MGTCYRRVYIEASKVASMMPGETITTGAPRTCPDCGVTVEEQVLMSGAGYYIGTECDCGPYSRESDYYPSREVAQSHLRHGAWDRTN